MKTVFTNVLIVVIIYYLRVKIYSLSTCEKQIKQQLLFLSEVTYVYLFNYLKKIE